MSALTSAVDDGRECQSDAAGQQVADVDSRDFQNESSARWRRSAERSLTCARRPVGGMCDPSKGKKATDEPEVKGLPGRSLDGWLVAHMNALAS